MTHTPDDHADRRRGIDHIGVSASFVVYDQEGRVLLQKRSANTRDEQGRWDNGGGAIELGESIDEAVRRELYEEFCITPLDIQFLTAYDAHRQLSDGAPTHWVCLLHAVKIDPAEAKIGEPHKIIEIGWFTRDQLPSPLHSQFWNSYQPALDRGFVK